MAAENKSAKESRKLFKKRRKRRLRTITVLPSLVTILNGVCGFAAIVCAGKAITDPGLPPEQTTLNLPYFAISGYLILLAMLADTLDGGLARISQSTSSFGGQLDSLCDMVSFGVAPAYLMLKLLEHEIAPGTYGGSELATLFSRFVWLAGAAYISCAAIRLARFNVENEQEESSHMSFLGLPSPAAAGTVISLVIFYQQMLPEFAAKNSILYYLTEKSVLYALPFVVLASAILMVSRIRYPHVVNQYLKGKKPFTHLLWLLLAIGVIIFWRVPVALVFIFCGYTGLGVTRWVNRFLKRVSGRAYQNPGASVYSETKSQTPTK